MIDAGAAYGRIGSTPTGFLDGSGLAEDYLAASPTPDRGLDLLPVLLHPDPARVRAALPRVVASPVGLV